MAEIKIEKKKPVWPWIIAVLIIAIIIYFFAFEDNDNENQSVDTTTNTEQITEENRTDSYETTGTSGEIMEIRDYITYIDDPEMGIDHEYTNSAIKKLIEAVEAKALAENVNLDADLNQAREKANAVTEDPNRLQHANMIKDAGQIIARAMKTLQTQNFPNSDAEISEVEIALKNIQTNQPTLEQKDAVKNFFSKAGVALTSMR